MPKDDPEATINVRRSKGAARSADPIANKAGAPAVLLFAAGLAGVLLIGGSAYWLLRPATNVPERVAIAPPRARPSIARPSIPRPALPHRDEVEIRDQRARVPTMVRFAPNPRILVIDFPDLRSQGLAFNRMAAFLEKAGLPRDRVLGDGELADAIRSDNATVETYYYGHDYRLAEVGRFFAIADRQRLALSVDEEHLRDILLAEETLSETAEGAIIAVPREGSDPFVDASGRASLLRHELSHGEYFTVPSYAAFARHFWLHDMTETDRASFRGFLTRQGYDPSDEDLLINETQAHLMATTDGRYFNARDCGLPLARVTVLRTTFAAKMPDGWLQNAVRQSLTRLP